MTIFTDRSCQAVEAQLMSRAIPEAIFVGESEFQSGDELNTPAGRLRSVLAFSTSTLPRLYELHKRDTEWDDGGRDAVRAEAVQAMRDHLGP